MYEADVQCVEQLKSKLQDEAPQAFAFLVTETAGAATSLEYYGMFGSALDAAVQTGLVPTELEFQVSRAKAAIRRIYERT